MGFLQLHGEMQCSANIRTTSSASSLTPGCCRIEIFRVWSRKCLPRLQTTSTAASMQSQMWAWRATGATREQDEVGVLLCVAATHPQGLQEEQELCSDFLPGLWNPFSQLCPLLNECKAWCCPHPGHCHRAGGVGCIFLSLLSKICNYTPLSVCEISHGSAAPTRCALAQSQGICHSEPPSTALSQPAEPSSLHSTATNCSSIRSSGSPAAAWEQFPRQQCSHHAAPSKQRQKAAGGNTRRWAGAEGTHVVSSISPQLRALRLVPSLHVRAMHPPRVPGSIQPLLPHTHTCKLHPSAVQSASSPAQPPLGHWGLMKKS